MLGLRGGASLKAAATMGGGPEEVVVVVVDGIADGFAPAVGTEGVDIFLLGDADGLQESLGQVGDGAGGSGFNIAADQGGAEIAGGEVVAGEEVGQVTAERLRGAGASFFLGVVEAEMGIFAGARGAATAAIREREVTQGHAVLGTERGHKSLLRVEIWDCLVKRTDNPRQLGDWRSRRTLAGKPAVQNRNAPAGAGAQFSTGILYHSGNAAQVRELEAEEGKKSQNPLLPYGGWSLH